MLNMFEMSDLLHFQESLPESKEKELLNLLLFEYGQYIRCGTVEDCEQRIEWMSYSIEDIRNSFNSIVKGLREEVENIRTFETTPPNKKRGRPCKDK